MAKRLKPHQRLERDWLHGDKKTGVCLLTSGPKIVGQFVNGEWSKAFTAVCKARGIYSSDVFLWNDDVATLEEAVAFVKEVEIEYEEQGGRL